MNFLLMEKKWIHYENDEVEIGATYSTIEYGLSRGFRVDIIVGNKGSEAFNFGGESRAWIVTKKNKYEELKGYTADEYNNLMGLMDFLDTPDGSGNAVLDAYNVVARSNRREVINEGYFKMNTIRPGQYKHGFVIFKYQKGSDFEVEINVKGKVYSFRW